MSLINHIKLRKRYTRSINLERDLQIVDSVLGYIPTPKTQEILDKFLNAFADNSIHAWTITGLYGTGKSAFAHFLSALCSPLKEKIKLNALSILNDSPELKEKYYDRFIKNFPEKGFVKAVVTASYEPVSHTIIKALYRGASIFWDNSKEALPLLEELKNLNYKISEGAEVSNLKALEVIKEIARLSQTGVLLIIDELGKNLEFASHNQVSGDLYLLQQIAELPSTSGSKVFIFGLLHSSFSDIGYNLSPAQRNEWAKIQGRFEYISFTEPDEEIISLISHAIDHTVNNPIFDLIEEWSHKWKYTLKNKIKLNGINFNNIKFLYPLHPLASYVLPKLCKNYAQNDRTLFTFLTSDEPYSLANFLREYDAESDLPTLKLHRLYDYFVESAGITTSSRPNYQRWVEIQLRIEAAQKLDHEHQIVLKTVGLLNLVSQEHVKASQNIVIYSLCDHPDEGEVIKYEKIIEELIKKNFLVKRKQIDELRIWEGSDFDIDEALSKQLEVKRSNILDLLDNYNPLSPLVAQRHSYETGTLRYFERLYIDSSCNIQELRCQNDDSDGLICYWIDKKELCKNVHYTTKEMKPLVVICPNDITFLENVCCEYDALNLIAIGPEIQSDGVARRELRERITNSKKRLDEAIFQSFNFNKGITCWISGEKKFLQNESLFKSTLSSLCNDTYNKGLHLWNELINRRRLTAQASNAMNKLIEHMINNTDKETFGIEGYGPERSIYEAMLKATDIHRKNGDKWEISVPSSSGVLQVWEAIRDFCFEATAKPLSLDLLYKKLAMPPYGVKSGPIPVLLTAVLLKYSDDISIYKDGTFITELAPEHIRLLEKNPERFSVKYIALTGLRLEIFKELEKILGRHISKGSRNEKLLGVIKPLIRFVSSLPDYTKNTKDNLSKETLSVRNRIFSTTEPDQLIFYELPSALKLKSVSFSDPVDDNNAKIFIKKLAQSLQELNNTYDKLLEKCRKLLCDAFSIKDDKERLRKELAKRARFLKGKCVDNQLTGFIYATIDDSSDDRKWLESVITVISGKPAVSWNDSGIILFENNLSNIYRKFSNLEGIHKELKKLKLGENYEVRRFTITGRDGKEINEMVWINKDDKKELDKITDNILNIISDKKDLQKFLIANLAEKILNQGK